MTRTQLLVGVVVSCLLPLGSHAAVTGDGHDSQSCARGKQTLAARRSPRTPPAWAAKLIDTASESDVEHYALQLEIDPMRTRLSGTNDITVTSATEGLRRFRFCLDDHLSIDRVVVDGETASWERLDGATVEVTLDPPREPDESFVVEVVYSGTPVLDTPGISFEDRNGHPDVTTRSEPWWSYVWWPVKEDNQDKATADVTLVVPDGLVGVSNGLLVDTASANGMTSYHWRTRYPTAPYLVFASVTNYNTFSDSVELDGSFMPLEFFIRPEEDDTEHREMWLRTKDMLAAFGDLFGTYPFVDEKYGIYQFSHGGMEHQTCSGQTGFSQSLTSHELAHQWWGDLVTCATWHDIWLNEGFATYAEALWLEHEAGEEGAAALSAAMADRRPEDPSGPVYVRNISTATPLFTELTYRKGAWVLHMLRFVLGDETFFSVLKRYADEHAFGTATTDDFRAVAEEVAHRDLRWFFDEWVYGSGTPRYGYAWREHVVAGRRYVELFIVQEQSPPSPLFRMPLDLRISTGSGRFDVMPVVDAARSHVLVEVSDPVVSVSLDPDGWVLDTGKEPVAFEEGPPKIVQILPAPGSVVASGPLAELKVIFHEDVDVDQNDFRLVQEGLGRIPLGFSYDRDTTTARLTPDRPLQGGRYVVTISDEITGAVSGQPLDGEIAYDSGAAVLPSGNGSPGGDSVVRFAVQGAPRTGARRVLTSPPAKSAAGPGQRERHR